MCINKIGLNHKQVYLLTSSLEILGNIDYSPHNPDKVYNKELKISQFYLKIPELKFNTYL
jgi:hypothetical protein